MGGRIYGRPPSVLGRSATPGVTEGARYSSSPSRLCPLETEQKAGVRNGKPDFSLGNQCCRRGCTSRRNPPPRHFPTPDRRMARTWREFTRTLRREPFEV